MEKHIQNIREVIQIPQQYLCPISTEIMKDPVIVSDGITYQKKSIEKWFEKSNYSPLTGRKLLHKTLIANIALKNTIQSFAKNNPLIVKEKYVNLEQAIKMREKQMYDYLKKNQKKNFLFQKQDENEYLTVKQLSRQLKISRTSFLEIQNMLTEALEKNITLQANVKELTEELKISRQKQCKCKINDKENQDQYKQVIQKKQVKVDQVSLIEKQNSKKNKLEQSSQKKQIKIDQVNLIQRQNFENTKPKSVIQKKQVKINQINLIKKQKPQERLKNKKKYSKQVQLYVKQIVKKNLKQQKKLELKQIKLNINHIGCLKQYINLTKLYSFQIHSCNFSDIEIKQLFNNQKNFQFSSLQLLIFYNNNITGEGIKHLCDAQDSLPSLFLLHLNENNRIRKKGMTFLGKSKLIHRLLALYIQNTFDGDKQQDCVKMLFEPNKIYLKLTCLSISCNNIGNKGLSDLCEKQFPKLSMLKISSNKISLQGIKQLIKNPKFFPNIKTLCLSHNDLCSQSIKVLVSQKQLFSKLQKFYINNNPNIGDQGINNLIQQQGSNAFPLLKTLNAYYCNVNDCNDKKNRIKQKYLKIQQIYLS